MKIIKKTKIIDCINYWDITIPRNHTFVLSNGIVVHNCGVGVGYSVERQYINKLPAIAEEFHPTDTVIVVKDSRIGWASAFRELITLLYSGHIPSWDLSKLRPAGAPLKVFGGRSGGPAPLNDLFNFTVATFKKAAGRKLNSIECNDLLCKVGDIVVSGGVRRCLPFDTLVQISPTNWKMISEITSDDKVYVDGEYHDVVSTFDQGEQCVDKIILDDGTYIESTPNHKWFVWNGLTQSMEWVATSDLTDNHYMVDPT